jgi:hypothetical protein
MSMLLHTYSDALSRIILAVWLFHSHLQKYTWKLPEESEVAFRYVDVFKLTDRT